MMRKIAHPIKGYDLRFIGNKHTGELHDLKNETNNCNINKITDGNLIYFPNDLLKEAYGEGFDNCAYCIGRSIK